MGRIEQQKKLAAIAIMEEPYWNKAANGDVVLSRQDFNDLVRRSAALSYLARYADLTDENREQCEAILDGPIPLS